MDNRDPRKDPQKDDEFRHPRGDRLVIERYECNEKRMVRYEIWDDWQPLQRIITLAAFQRWAKDAEVTYAAK